MANGNEIINTSARFKIDESLGNVLQWPDEFYEARAAGSLAETECCCWVKCVKNFTTQYFFYIFLH